MILLFDLTTVDPRVIEYANERMKELQGKANYLTRVLGQTITLEDIIDIESEEE